MREEGPVTSPSSTLRQLFALMKERGVTNVETCHRLGINVEQMRRWKRGISTPNILNVEYLAMVLDCDIVVIPRGPKQTQLLIENEECPQ